MAKRKGKGKAGRRIKDWRQRFSAGESPDDIAHRGLKPGTREVKLPQSRLDAPEENLANLPKKEGLVVAVYRRAVSVLVDGSVLYCAIVKTFRSPATSSAMAVGDIVTVALVTDLSLARQEIDKERMDGFILNRRPRQTALSRPRPTSAKRFDQYQSETFEQVIAANMDQLLIVASMVQPRFRRRLVDRYMIVAERGELAPLLVFNKTDLHPPPQEVLDDIKELGLDVLCCSAKTGEGVEDLRIRLAGKRSVLAGASGVGKSTLVNSLVPTADAATRTVRPKDLRGRHTTAAATIYFPPDPAELGIVVPPMAPLKRRGWAAEVPVEPLAEGELAEQSARPEDAQPALPFVIPPGGMLVDTPGVRELGFAMNAGDLPWYFPEFDPFVHQCKFNNCTHIHEPKCAVIEAVESGDIPARRYESYLLIRLSLREK